MDPISNVKLNGLSSKSIKISVALVVLSLIAVAVYQPLPDDFEQPWKYRIVCFGAVLLKYVGHALEYVELSHRLNLTRFAYHWSIGAFNIRDENDFISVTNDNIGHVAVRIYRPLNATSYRTFNGKSLSPTIIFYHGGGHGLGSADILEHATYLLAKHTNYVVIYVEFRLVPEHKYPSKPTTKKRRNYYYYIINF
jgi:hypothetical protein